MKSMTKSIALALALLLAATLLAACGGGAPSSAAPAPAAPSEAPQPGDAAPEATGEGQGEGMSMVMITDAGGLGDGGFNDMAWAGLEMARDDMGFEIGVIESSEAAQFAPNIQQAAEQGYDIVVCVGFLFVDVLTEVAPQYPDTSFIMIDAEVEGDNVYSFMFDVQESSFMAGALAGLVREETVFGYVGGMEIPVVEAWESGFISGIKTTKPGAEVRTAYVGSFADPGKAKELALAHFNAGAGVCMEVSSGGAIGVIEAAQEAGKEFVATDQSKDSFAPGSEFTAALAKRDFAVYNAAKMIFEGTAVPGTTYLSMKDDVFGLPENTEERYGAEVMATLSQLMEMIVNGELDVPATRDEVAAYEAPAL